MSNLIAIFVILAATGMLIAYYLGYSAGQQKGREQGHQEGKEAGSVRAFAVGYDRGRHDREVKEREEQEKSGGRLGWRLRVAVIVLAGTLAALVWILRGTGLNLDSFSPPSKESVPHRTDSRNRF